MTEKQIKIENLKILKYLLPELNIEVESPCGYSKILAYDVTSENSEFWTLETETGKTIRVSKDHLIRTDLKLFKPIDELKNEILKKCFSSHWPSFHFRFKLLNRIPS